MLNPMAVDPLCSRGGIATDIDSSKALVITGNTKGIRERKDRGMCGVSLLEQVLPQRFHPLIMRLDLLGQHLVGRHGIGGYPDRDVIGMSTGQIYQVPVSGMKVVKGTGDGNMRSMRIHEYRYYTRYNRLHDMFSFTITHTHQHSRARAGSFETPHGPLATPNLALVATEGVFKCLPPEQVGATDISYGIANTFHIWAKDILPQIQAAGGIHRYMQYDRALATDSGGFQVFSLGFGTTHGTNKLGAIFPGEHGRGSETQSDSDNPVEISEDGVTFPFNGRTHTLTPELSMELQHRIGADIIFAFDECTSSLNSKEYTAQSLERTHRWLDRCITHHQPQSQKQALFGIVQGGAYRDLREQSARYLAKVDVPGYGIGGSLGTTKQDMYQILDWTIPLLPTDRPRHLLGIGTVPDIFAAVRRGIDLFDCVIPTREARHRILYTQHGRIAVRKMRDRDEIIDARPGSPTLAEEVTFAQLAAWFRDRDPRACTIATKHNIFFFTRLMQDIRDAIAQDRFDELETEMLQWY